MTASVYLTSLGCRLNEAETSSWARAFARVGYRVVAAPDSAQLIVVNTCAVTREAARKSRKLVARLHRTNPTAPVVLSGCFAELEVDRARALAGVDLVLGNRDKDSLVERVLAELPIAFAGEPAAEGPAPAATSRTRAFVKVQDGCKNRCTFCIVTIARGAERSRPIDEVIAELNSLAALGYREAVLTGVHLGGYGRDLGTDLSALVAAVVERTELPRIRLSSLEPWDLPPDFERMLAHPRLMPHLHLPLQSGSDAVLRRMARQCSVSDFEQLVGRARAAIPDLSVTTDIIVGFPGETDAEWTETLRTLERIGFAHVHIFAYSRRGGTVAARMPNQVPSETVRERSRELHQLAARMKRSALTAQLGATRPVLWEEEIAGHAGRERQYVGYTDNYLRAVTAAPPELELTNRIAPVQLVSVDAAGELLLGRIAP